MRLAMVSALVLTTLLAPAGAVTAATWSQENADAANHNRMGQDAPRSIPQGTFTNLDDQVLAQVTEGPAGLALAASLSGTIAAIDATGELAWHQRVDGELRNAPAWTGEVIVALPRGDTAYGLAPNGEIAWRLGVDNERDATVVRMASPVVHPSGDVVLATLHGEVLRVSSNGEVVWAQQVGDGASIQASPALTEGGDVIVAAFEPGRGEHGSLVRLEGASGDVDWSRQIGAQVVGAPTVYADIVLVPLRDGEALEARSLSTGHLRWDTAFDDSITASPAIHDGLAIVGDIAGTVRGVQLSGGKVDWSFHPVDDDPEAGVLSGAAYTVADSAAVDERGVAWTSYWVVDLFGGFPPQDSQASPIYRLDARTGELLDRRTNDKATHGPALHETGVWAGSDEEGVRSWSSGSTLEVYALGLVDEVLLIVNTDRSGAWEIRAGGELLEEGHARPPVVSTHPLEAGEQEIIVTVDGQTARRTVTVNGEQEARGDDPIEEAAGQNGGRAPEGSPNEDGGTDADDAEGPDPGPPDGGGGDENLVPIAPLLATMALAIAAGVRPRA